MKEVSDRRRKPENEIDNDKDQQTKQNPRSLSSVSSSGSYFFTFILLIVTLLIYDVILTSENIVDIEAIKRDLVSNVYNQTQPLEVILDSLSQLQNYEKNLNIVNFFGSTGVGKTFIANILKNHFHPSIYELNGSFDTNLKQNTLNRLRYANHNNPNLIVVDDLVVDDVDGLLSFLKEIPQECMAFVVCIFNIQETDDDLIHRISYHHIDMIVEKFNKAEISHKVAKFHEFDRNQAREWVIKQLEQKQVNPQLHSVVVESVLNSHNIKYHGLKGLSSKINLKL